MLPRLTRSERILAAVIAFSACDGPWCSSERKPFELPKQFEEIKLVADHFMTAVGTRRYADAYAMLCEGTRSTLPRDRFDRAMTENAYLRTAKAGKAERTSFGNGVGELHGVMATEAGFVKVDFAFSTTPRLCITGLHVGGVPALPGPSSF